MKLVEKARKNLVIRLATAQERLLSGLPPSEIEAIAGNIAAMTRSKPDPALPFYARSLAERSAAPNEFLLNGEKHLLDLVAPLNFATLFDAGANVGVWSRHAVSVFPKSELHAFEIVPSTFAELRRRLPEETRLHLNPFGLSDEAGYVTVYTYPSHHISSMFSMNHLEPTGSIQCEVLRGIDYAVERGVRNIDFLKIDVEGAEKKVLNGFEPMISEGLIRMIQFEYNKGAILGDFLLRAAYEFFIERNYVLGRLFPQGVFFHDYSLRYEDFIGPNYVAIRRDDLELASLIGVR